MVTVSEAGRRGLSDAEHLQWARKQGRVVITHDDDFLVLASRMFPFAGIAYCHEPKYAVGALSRRVAELADEMEGEEWANRVTYL